MGHAESKFQPANIAVLTVSDTRIEENDTSGRYLVEHAQEAGHNVVDKQIVIDDMYKIRFATQNGEQAISQIEKPVIDSLRIKPATP